MIAPSAQIAHVVRRLRRAPGYVAAAVGLLGLGLGVLAATYTVLDQVVLEALPVEDQERVVVAWMDHTVRGFDHYPVTAALFDAAESGGVPALERVAAIGSSGTASIVVDGTDGPQLMAWARTLGDFFGVLGASPQLGRAPTLADDAPGAPDRVAVISDGLWERGYARSPDVVGEVLRTRAGAFTIIGVMPPGFDYPLGAEVWAPTRPGYPDWPSELPRLELDLLGRLAPGASVDAVGAQLATLASSTPELREVYAGTVPVVRAFEDHVLGPLEPTLVVLFLGGLLVLVVATLDLANMVLVRTVADRGQRAVRRALGMNPRDLLVEALVEAGVIAALAVGVGAAVANAAVRLTVPLAPPDVTRLGLVTALDATAYLVLVVGALVAVGSAVVAPRCWSAWREGDAGLGQELREARSPAGRWSREAVVVGQIGIAVWVLVVGTLLVRTVVNLSGLDPGFRPQDLSLVQLDHASEGVLAAPGEDLELAAAVRRIERSPGVIAATPLQMAPLPGNAAWQTILFKEGQTDEEALEQNGYLFMEFVEPDFAEILGARLVEGRMFTEADGAGAPPVVVVNESAARRYWPGARAVGQQVASRLPGAEGALATVVGVLADTRYGTLTEFAPTVYFPVRQNGAFGARYLLVRLGAQAPLLEIAREALAAEAPRYRAVEIVSVRDRLAEPLARPRFAAVLLTLLAATSLLIAFAGVYATMAVLVRARAPELGVRLACGGTPTHVGALVVRRGLLLGLAGSVLGGVAAVASGDLVRSLLFNVEPGDVASLAAGVFAALVCAGLACLAPALRAASTDPAVVLRSD